MTRIENVWIGGWLITGQGGYVFAKNQGHELALSSSHPNEFELNPLGSSALAFIPFGVIDEMRRRQSLGEA